MHNRLKKLDEEELEINRWISHVQNEMNSLAQTE